MACRGCLECLLKLLNFILTLVGLAMLGYGIYLLVEYMKVADTAKVHSPMGETDAIIQLGRPMLMAVSLSDSFLDNLPKAWFIYLFIGVGVIIFVISCFGCIGAVTRNGCCLSCYSVLLVLLILVELGAAAFIFFDKSWQTEIPTDATGDFDMIYDFLEVHWAIVRWVVLGAVIFEALIFLLALGVRAVNRPVEYDSDEEPLINRPHVREKVRLLAAAVVVSRWFSYGLASCMLPRLTSPVSLNKGYAFKFMDSTSIYAYYTTGLNQICSLKF